MIRRYLAAGLTVLVLLLGQAATAESARVGIKTKWWQAPKVQQALRLSGSEMERLEQMNLAMKRKIIRYRATIQECRLMLDSLLDKEPVNEAEVRRLNQQVSRAQAGISRAQSNFIVEVRKLLGPRRFQKLKQLFRTFKNR